MLSFFTKKLAQSKYKVDFHSHLIPDIDDGVKDLDESIERLRFFSELGYTKVITTPHIHWEYFRNTEKIILDNFKSLKNRILEEDLMMEVSVAAEYFVAHPFLLTVF